MAPQIYLASRSPRRQALLQQIGVAYRLIDIEVDESPRTAESPAEYVIRVSQDKALAGQMCCREAEYLPVLAADTCVVVDDHMLGKPKGRQEGLWMLQQLSGRTHEVYSAVALAADGMETRLSVSQVSFRPLSMREQQAYWDSGEPADKAGAYAIQGLAAQFICALHGSYSAVMGLPLYETAELLRHAGIELLNPGDPLAGSG